MALSPRHEAPLQPLSSTMTPKLQLIYKLLLLENARNTLEQELLVFIAKAYEGVQDFFTSSFPTCLLRDLGKSLDSKFHVLDKLLAVFKELRVEPQNCVKHGMGKDSVQPLGMEGIQMTDVKFGRMLQNSLMASSKAKAVRVFGTTRPFQQLKHFPILLPSTIQEDIIGRIVPRDNSTFVTKNTSFHLRAHEKERAIHSEEDCPRVDVISQPASGQSPKKLQLQPSKQDVVPKSSNPRPMEITPSINWGCTSDVRVYHQKQTTSQLLQFIRTQNVTPMDWNIKSKNISSSAQSVLPPVKTPRYKFGGAVMDDMTDSDDPKTLSTGIEIQTPIFRVKRVETSGSLTYACAIVTKTEVWDVGDIFTEVREGASEAKPLENKDDPHVTGEVENCVNIHQTQQSTEPEHEGSSSTKMPEFNNVLIPEFCIKRFEETEVVVSHIVNPGNFYIQRADSTMKLQALNTDSLKASCSYAKQNCIPDIGTKVMGWFHKPQQWCRAQVTKMCGVSGDGAGGETSVAVEVRRLDYGDTACLSLWNIKQLTPEMAVLPLQAVRVSLANVMPVNGGNWSEEAVCWFQAMAHNRILYARLYPEGPKVTVELFLEKGKLGAMRRGASLSVRLAQNGHAKSGNLRNEDLGKKCAAEVKKRKLDTEWEKYLISCYIQSRK